MSVNRRAGALLAVPLTIALRALLLPFQGTAWFVGFLGQEVAVGVDEATGEALAVVDAGPDDPAAATGGPEGDPSEPTIGA